MKIEITDIIYKGNRLIKVLDKITDKITDCQDCVLNNPRDNCNDILIGCGEIVIKYSYIDIKGIKI